MNYIGIGKIVLDSLCTEEYNISHLHFLLTKNDDGFIESVNLEFGIVAFHKDADEAVKILIQLLIEYIKRTIDEDGFDSLIHSVQGDEMNEYWAEYRKFEFILAKQKRDLSHDFVRSLTRKIANEIFEMYGIKPKAKYSVLDMEQAA